MLKQARMIKISGHNAASRRTGIVGYAALLLCACTAPAFAQTVIYRETFDNGNGTVANPRLVTTYTGPTGMTYTANTPWVTICNGWIAPWNSPLDYAPAIDATQCNGQPSWNSATLGAQALGAYINNVAIASAAAQNNLAMMAYTAGDPGTASNLVVRNATPIPFPAVPAGGTGRFVTFSFVAAAQNCFANPPLVTFSILNPAETQLGTGNTNLCTGGVNVQTYTATALRPPIRSGSPPMCLPAPGRPCW